MANKRISQLPAAASPLAGGTLLPVELTTGDTKRATLQQMRSFVSVTDYGADPTGVQDSSAAFQAAIDASDFVVVPPGTYKTVARVNVNKSMTIRVDGDIQTTGYQFQVNPPSIFYVTADNVLIEGSGTLSGPGVFTHATVTNIQYIPSLIKIDSADNVTVRGLTFVDGPQACVIYIDSDYVKITDCTFIGGDTVASCVAAINYYAVYGYTSDFSVVSNNRFLDDASGNTFAEAIFLYFVNYSEITDNYFKNIVDHDVYMYHSIGDLTGVNNYNTVSHNVSYTNLVSPTQKIGSSFKVHGAFNAINDNDIVNTCCGIVLECGSYSTISDNTISGFNTQGIIVSDLVSPNAAGLNYITVSNNTLYGAAANLVSGIYFRGDATYTTANCVGGKIIGNTVVRCGDPGGSVPSPIELYHSNTSYFMDAFMVSNNVIVGQTGVFGMYFSRVRYTKIENNIIKDGVYTPWRGVHFANNSSFNRISGNIVRDDQATPKLSIGCNFANTTMTDNVMTGNIFNSLYATRDVNPWRLDATFGNIGDQNTNGDTLGYPVALSTAEDVQNITASTSVLLGVLVPTGARVIGVQLRVDSALAAGDTWNAAYSGGLTTSIATSQAVAKNTKVSVLYNSNAASDITTNTTNITITRSGGGSFTAQGRIRALVYYELLTALGDAP